MKAEGVIIEKIKKMKKQFPKKKYPELLDLVLNESSPQLKSEFQEEEHPRDEKASKL